VPAGSPVSFESFQSALAWRGTPWLVNGAVALFVTLSLWQNVSRLSDQPTLTAQYPALPVASNSLEQDLDALLAVSLFGQATTVETPETAPLTSLNLVLKGVVAIKDAGMAFISASGKPEELYVVGQDIAPGATLSAVHPDRIILRRGGQFESLMLEGADMNGIEIVATNQPLSQPVFTQIASPGKGSAERPYVVSRASLRAEVRNPQELLSQAVLVPNVGGGFLLKEVQADSLIDDFGLRPGDVIRAINGHIINYADDIRRAYEQLGNANEVKVELLRDGKQAALHYRVVEGSSGTVKQDRPVHNTTSTHFDSPEPQEPTDGTEVDKVTVDPATF
jgi:general secretion pathway protein C